jgi:hypothetical protein
MLHVTHTLDSEWCRRHCEVPSTTVCHFSDDDTAFCANNGNCPATAHEDCSCKDGFHGAHCEFTADEKEEEHAKCELTCKNGGTCRKGTIQDEHTQDLIQQYGGELSHMSLNVSHNEDFE